MRLLLLSCCLCVFFAGCTKEETPAVVKKSRARFKNGLDVDINNFRFQSSPELAVLKIDSLKKGAYSDYIENPEIYQNHTATDPVYSHFNISIPNVGSYTATGTLLGITAQKLFPRDYTIVIVFTGIGANRLIKFEFEK
jgi:hypothetical protein